MADCLIAKLIFAIIVHVASARNCTAAQRSCKPSCTISEKSRKDALGNRHQLQGKICRMCKCSSASAGLDPSTFAFSTLLVASLPSC